MTRENSMTIRTQASQERLQNRQQGMTDRLNARRKIKELVDDLSQRPDRPMPTLRPEESRGGIPSRRGYVERAYQPGSGSGTAGIASPLTEQHFSTREYWEDGIPSSDGLFLYPAPKKVKMTDATGAEVIFDYADPSAPVSAE